MHISVYYDHIVFCQRIGIEAIIGLGVRSATASLEMQFRDDRLRAHVSRYGALPSPTCVKSCSTLMWPQRVGPNAWHALAACTGAKDGAPEPVQARLERPRILRTGEDNFLASPLNAATCRAQRSHAQIQWEET